MLSTDDHNFDWQHREWIETVKRIRILPAPLTIDFFSWICKFAWNKFLLLTTAIIVKHIIGSVSLLYVMIILEGKHIVWKWCFPSQIKAVLGKYILDSTAYPLTHIPRSGKRKFKMYLPISLLLQPISFKKSISLQYYLKSIFYNNHCWA